MSETATANPPPGFPWTGLLQWQPFQIDALGLITLLGAEEVNASVGRLVRSTWLEYLPLLGAYVIANERFREKEAGFHLYNISKGIATTDLAPWFSRWIKAQDFEQTRSFVRWTVEKRPNLRYQHILGFGLSFSAIGFLLAMTVLSYDWYGFANALSMASSVMVRHYMIESMRDAIDEQVLGSRNEDKRPLDEKKEKLVGSHPLDRGWLGKNPSKLLIITSDAKAVTMLIPEELMKPPSPFIARLQPHHRFWYGVMRWAGWIAFAVQVISIGMADLATQLVTVFLLVVPTVLHVSKLGCDDSKWKQNIARGWEKFRGMLGKEPPRPKPDEEKIGTEVYISQPNEPKAREFSFKYACWIGNLLKAEVYEWPMDHHYTFTGKDERGPRRVKPYVHTNKPFDKRQYLYAWLQLTKQETDSMDKWDLLPHDRPGHNDGWLKDYQMGRDHVTELNRQGQGIMKIIARAPGAQAQDHADTRAADAETTRSSADGIHSRDFQLAHTTDPNIGGGLGGRGSVGAANDSQHDPLPSPRTARDRAPAAIADPIAHEVVDTEELWQPLPPRRRDTGMTVDSANYVSHEVAKERRLSLASLPPVSRGKAGPLPPASPVER
ncbi:uncharacterized protein HMPREF1541_01228 [Cyphellophora europaea CBS 101466]|uniref:Uncharacterized protein n=1 Tax=Cyphellophora europaea (strain CBS 101466) TaxID=1220924 RepID=W2SGB0_CYPE1|nr:uncharacterized protein HMPREF1541_01228 [Cyphellophora europaea CBS 101466]ETN47038.1 hypothetical protein HMPREF1541_01228 [Cyphellophora europaea CBS 101466]